MTVTLVGFSSSSPDDMDLGITGPNGQTVMLMSDACGETPATIDDDTLTFDDSAATFVPNGGSCGNDQVASYKPADYQGLPVEPDDLSVAGGPASPYLNALSFLAGSSPNGAWNLYALDDNSGGFVGFGIIGWALTLDTQDTQPPAATGQTASHRKCQKRRSASAAKKRCKKKR